MATLPGVARRLRDMQAPVIPDVAALLRAHPDAISLGQGVPAFAPPAAALSAAALLDPAPSLHRYQPGDGDAELRALWQATLAADNAIGAGAGELVVTAGSNMAFLEVMAVIADAGDQVILPAPYFFNQRMALQTLGIEPVLVPTLADHQLDVQRIADAMTPRTRAVVTVSPNNPSGAVYAEADLRAVNALCGAHGCFHVSDEAYEHFVFAGARHFSPASIDGAGAHTISLFSMSKSYGMSGWRIGAALLPTRLLQDMRKVQDTLLISAPLASQRLAAVLLREHQAWRVAQVSAIGALRERVLAALPVLPGRLWVPRSAGAFYLLLRLAVEGDDMAVVRRLVAGFGVALIPGSAFGCGPQVHLRLAYGGLGTDALDEAMARLDRGLRAVLGED